MTRLWTRETVRPSSTCGREFDQVFRADGVLDTYALAAHLGRRGLLEHEYRAVQSAPVSGDRRRQVPELRTLMIGIVFGESPRWHDDRLWFSYWGVQEVVAVDFEGNSASGLVILTYEPDRNQGEDRS